jgi:hypothetical protein
MNIHYKFQYLFDIFGIYTKEYLLGHVVILINFLNNGQPVFHSGVTISHFH